MLLRRELTNKNTNKVFRVIEVNTSIGKTRFDFKLNLANAVVDSFDTDQCKFRKMLNSEYILQTPTYHMIFNTKLKTASVICEISQTDRINNLIPDICKYLRIIFHEQLLKDKMKKLSKTVATHNR